MKKFGVFKNLILILLAAVILSLALFACAPKEEEDNGQNGTDVPTYTREEILDKLSTSLDGSVERLAAARTSGQVTTSSEYSIIVEDLKYTVKYNAAIDYSHIENSRIYFKVYDDESHMTRIMAHYDAGTLYYENNGGKKKISGFGTSGVFSLFLGIIENADLSYSLENIASIVSGTALENLIRTNNLKLYAAGENRTNISIQNIQLDTLKTVPNNMIADFFGSFGTSFDAIGSAILGATPSDLGTLRIRSLDANRVEFYSENDVCDQVYFDFSGYMETLSPFSLKGGFRTVPGMFDIEVDAREDGFLDFTMGEGSFAGTVGFPSINAVYDSTLDFSVNYKNNNENLAVIKLKDSGLDAAASYYLDGKLYLDAGNLFEVFNAGLGLSYFNLPKAVVADFDLSANIANVIDILDNLVRERGGDISKDKRDEVLKVLIPKIKSDGSVISVTVDKELIKALNGISENPVDADNVAEYLGSLFGVSQTFIDNVLGASVFDDLALILSFDFGNGGFSVVVRFGEKTVIECDFEPVPKTSEVFEEVAGASVSVKPAGGLAVNLSATVDGKTYNLNGVTGTVSEVGSDRKAGSYYPESKKFSVDGTVYSFSAPDLYSQDENKKVGVFSVTQKKLSLNDATYRFDDGGRVLFERLSGSFDAPYLILNSTRYYVRDGRIYESSDSENILGTIQNGIVSMGLSDYAVENGDLFEIAGAVNVSGDVITVSAGDKIYVVKTGTVYRERGIFREDEGVISLGGVNYYVNDGKVYKTVDFVEEVGSVAFEQTEINLNGGEFRYDYARKEVAQHVFGEIIYPEEYGFSMSGEIKVSGKESQDISALVGAFIGDSLGLNTPVKLKATDRLLFVIKARYGTVGQDGVYVKLTLKTKAGTERILVEAATFAGDSEQMLLDFKPLSKPFRFRSPVSETADAFRRFAGEGSVFGEEDIMGAVLSALAEASVVYDREGIRFSFDYHAIDGQEVYDPLLKLIGISNLSASGTLKADYSVNMEEWRVMNADSDSFILPELESFPEIVDNYESIYDAEWIEEISFVNPELEGLTLKIPYDPATVKVETGKNVYHPRASLLGQVLTYTLMLKGGENATKVAVEVVGNAIVFDSYEKNPVHEKIAVRYDDGTEGEVRYKILGFGEDLITEAGMPAALYTVVIGEGKIAETKFAGVAVSVRSRALVKQTADNPDGYGSHYQSTVIGSMTVDPYEYAISGNELAIPEEIALRFKEEVRNDDGTVGSAIVFDKFRFEWEFDGRIDVSGGTFYARVARIYKEDSAVEYIVPDLAYEINVLPKIFSYMQFGKESGRGVYTVDVLDGSTYTVPARSREGYRLAVYFADGHYRIIGSEAMGLETDSMFDGYFDLTLEWKYPAATHFSLRGYSNPLGGETAQNTAVLEFAGLSSQELNARILEPSREVKEIDTVFGIVKNVIEGGTVKRDKKSFRYDNATFAGSEFITVNPYRTEALPEVITLNIADKLTGEISSFDYPVESWLLDGEILKEQDGKFYLKYPETEESWFRAEAVVGNGRVTDRIVVRIYNPNAEYAGVTFEGYSENVLETVADAYSPLSLPKGFSIRLEDGTVLRYGDGEDARAFVWKVDFGTEREREATLLGEEDYQAFRAFIEGRSRVYDPSWFNKGFNLENRDYAVKFTAHVPSDVNGSLEQAIEFTVNVRSLQPLRVDDGATSYMEATSGTVNIDRYHENSAELLRVLTEDGMSVLPIKMFAPQNMEEITYFFKVDWNDTSEFERFIAGMKTVDGGETYVLKGTILRDVVGKNQTFDVAFATKANEVLDAASFYFRSLSTALPETLTADYQIDGGRKTLTVNLKEPYALKLLSGGNFAYALPSDYFAFTLSDVYLVFADGLTATYPTDVREVIDGYLKGEKSFDRSVYDFGSSNTASSENEIRIRVSEGSCEDYVYIRIVASPDVATVFTPYTAVEPYNENGTLKFTIENGYAAGYPVSNEYNVTYNNSGTVVYNLEWVINNPVVNNGLGLVYNETEKVWYLPIASVSQNGGSSTLTGFLPDGTEVRKTVSVNPKNIGGTAYNAQAAFEGGASVANGRINFANMYRLFEIMKVEGGRRVIDVSKLPSVIEPRATATFAGNTKFRVNWQTENYFAVEEDGRISGEPNGDGCYLIAHADIAGYNGESQRVYLYINVAETEGVAEIRAEGYDFRMVGEGFKLLLDPYKDNGRGGYDWTVALPKVLSVDLFGGSSYSFAEGISYKYGDITVDSAVIDYCSLLKLVGDAETAIGDVSAELILTLPDGFEIPLTVEVIPRIIEGVEVPYTTADGSSDFRDGTYYIDPYNAETYEIPNTVKVLFAGGESLDLTVDWQIVGANLLEIDYRGGEYSYTATLGGEGADISEAQVIELTVTVLDRSLKEGFAVTAEGMTAETDADGTLVINRHFADYIGARAADIFVHNFVPEDFAYPELPEGAGNMQIAYPVLKIYIAEGMEADDSAIENAMASVEFSAALSSGVIKGQAAKVRITTDRLTLIDDFADFAADDGKKLFFNPFNKDSLKTEFRLTFSSEVYDPETESWEPSDVRTLTFYTEKSSADDYERSRRLIYWDESMSEQSSGVAEFSFGNAAKIVGSVQNTVNYIYLQVGTVRLDLGFGMKESGAEPFDYVVDPLTPELIREVPAEGKINGEWYSLGTVALYWEDGAVLDGVSLTGEARRTVAVNLDAGISGIKAIPISVNVYYLDRTVRKAFTGESGFSVYTEGNRYKIYDSEIIHFVGMEVDPIAKFENGRYVYPSDITAEFYEQAAGASPSIIAAAIEKYGSRLSVSGALWGLNGKAVTLAGTGSAPINLALVGGTIARGEKEFAAQFMETADRTVNPFVFSLTVFDRSITATSITKSSDIHVAFDGENGTPNYSIDPYNITLPKSIVVTFGTGAGGVDMTRRTYSWQNAYNELWTFDAESYERLQRDDIISGGALESEMYAIAYFTVNSETFGVKFPITARNIDVNGDWGSSEVVKDGMIPAGTIYVKAGANVGDIVAQLPKEIYYNFAPSADSQPDYSPLPIKYDNVSFFKAGTYTLRATLGKVNKEFNALFTVEVINPELKDIRTVTDAVGTVIDFNVYDFVYDSLPVSVNSSGNLMSGLESERMPAYIATADGTYIKISGISYSLADKIAELTCTYEFITATDGPRIAGRADGARTRDFVFEVPLTLNATDMLSGDAELSADEVFAELGQPIKLSSMPVAVSDGREYKLFWDIYAGGVDVNVSGDYTVTGYLLDSFNSVRTYNVTLKVAKRELLPSEFGVVGTTIDERLEISFSGRRVDWQYKVPSNCIDENGDRFSPVPKFMYSSDGGESWTSIQPIAVGSYLMKITVDKTNVFGEKTVSLRIKKAEINTDDITFADTSKVYNGLPQQPTVLGLPASVGYSFRMTRRTDSGDTVEHPEGAINAYAYTATLIIEESDSYVFIGVSRRSTAFVIEKANPAYRAATSEVYNGLDRHIYVEGMPEYMTGGMTVTYTYTNKATGEVTTNRIRNVGVYRYSIEIHGGINYHDNNLGGDYTITQAPLTVDVGNVSVPYLDEPLPLNAAVTVSGVVGDDASKVFGSVFGELLLESPVRLDGYAAPGSYPIYASGLRNSNYRIEYIDDTGNESGNYRYNVVLPEGTIDVGRASEEAGVSVEVMLKNLIKEAKNGDLKLFIPKGEYGDLTLSEAGVSLYLYGEYEEDGTAATVLDSLTVSGGTVNLYALSFRASDGTASVRLKGNAGSLLLDRVVFSAKKTEDGTPTVAPGSSGIYADHEFGGTVSAYRITVLYRLTGIYMGGGTLEVENSMFDGCVAGIEAQGQSVNIANSVFAHSTLHAVYLTGSSSAVSVSGNEFRYNVVAVKYNYKLNLGANAEVVNENVYFKNNDNLISQ